MQNIDGVAPSLWDVCIAIGQGKYHQSHYWMLEKHNQLVEPEYGLYVVIQYCDCLTVPCMNLYHAVP